jgi:ribosomal protein S18 acetylase RimI-like enzyme
MLIRRARPEEYDAVGRVTVAAYGPFLDETDDVGYTAHLRDTAPRAREAEVWVAVDDDDTLLGSVTVAAEGSPWQELARPGEGEFRMLAVDPAAQGRGVGLALVQHVVDGFRERGARAIVMCSMETMTAAHHIYRRLGFTRDPERDWSPTPGLTLIAFSLGLDEETP